MATNSGNRWDIDWQKIGLSEPKVRKIAKPQSPSGFSTTPVIAPAEVKSSAPKLEVVKTQTQNVPASVIVPEAENDSDQVNDLEIISMEKNMVDNKRAGQGGFVGSSSVVNDSARDERVSKARQSVRNDKRADSGKRRGRDLSGGLEMLDLNFMLGVVENVDASEANDITMRKLGFKDLIRTSRVHEVDSMALKVYAVDADGLFGKDIQFEAFKELAERTSHSH